MDCNNLFFVIVFVIIDKSCILRLLLDVFLYSFRILFFNFVLGFGFLGFGEISSFNFLDCLGVNRFKRVLVDFLVFFL